jgi:hypothetical protein
MFLLNKLGYFVDSFFFLVVTDGCVLSCLGGFNFDVLWLEPWLCCFVHYYHNDVFFL